MNRLSPGLYSDIVHRWNHLRRADRVASARRCVDLGHQWREAPMSTDADPVRVCTRCLKYASGKPVRPEGG